MGEVGYKTYHKIALDLWSTSRLLLEGIKQQPNRHGAKLYEMPCATMQAFTVEAMLNFFGYRVFIDAWPEKAAWAEKLKLLCHQLDVSFPSGEEPFASVRMLMAYRNKLAHGKASPVETLPNDHQATEIPSYSPHWIDDISVGKLKKNDLQLKRLILDLLRAAGMSLQEFYIVEEGLTGAPSE